LIPIEKPEVMATVSRVDVWSGSNAFSYPASARSYILSASERTLISIEKPEVMDGVESRCVGWSPCLLSVVMGTDL
jgi:hypothetical protein